MNSNSSNSEAENSKNSSPYISVFILTLATFMSVLDSTVVFVSLPKMAADLSSTPTEMIWIISAYIVANVAILPISGWLATYFGRKRFYIGCVVGFTVTSVLCGLATNLETLIFFRVLQGLSAGGIAPSEQAIIADITPKEKLGRTFSIYGLGISIAPILGPTLGGFITDTFSWHWIFFINLPIGIISIILTSLFVNESEKAKEVAKEAIAKAKKVDWIGIFLFVTGIAALEVFLGEGPKEGWFESDFILLIAAYCAVALIIGIAWEYYQKEPAVDILMFKNWSFTSSCILILTVSLVISGVGFLIPFFTQTLLGYTAMDAGLIGLPGTICQLIVIQIIGILSDKIDIRKIIFAGLILTTLAVINFANFSLNNAYNDIVWMRIFYSCSVAFLATTINTVAYYDISPEKNNSASALLNLVRNVGASLGIALTSTIIAVKSQVHINDFTYYTNSLNPNFTQTISNMSQYFQEKGLGAVEAAGVAQGVIWNNILRQSTLNAILDTVNIYIVLHLLVIPVVFLLKKKNTEH
jgi:MFS transporter, DHA2 family, multidrug resistance protein